MNGPPLDFSVWTRGRLFGVIGGLFVLQVGLIALFGARETKPAPAAPSSNHVWALGVSLNEEQLRRLFFASDPTLFPLPGPRGFSGRAWMNQPPPQYQATNQLEAPLSLALDASRLGSGITVGAERDESTPLIPAALQVRQLEPLPVFLAPEIVPTQSVFRIEGELAQRLAVPAPKLSAWLTSGTKLLTNTVVQVAVNGNGDVLAARLLSRCGLGDADADAVAKAWALRFRPVADAPTIWGGVIFQWQTIFPAAGPRP